MLSVYRLSLRQLSGKWRMLITILLILMPITMSVIQTLVDDGPPDDEFVGVVFGGMLIGSILPIIVLAISSAAFANEIEDRTLANLVLSPIARWKIIIPKLLASITIAAPFLAISAVVASSLSFESDTEAVIAVTVGTLVGVLVYSSVFLWAGLMSTRAIGFGLLYVFLWEGLFSGMVSGIRFLSIRHYATAIVHGMDERQFGQGDTMSLATSVGAAAAVFVIFVLLSIRRLRRMDVP